MYHIFFKRRGILIALATPLAGCGSPQSPRATQELSGWLLGTWEMDVQLARAELAAAPSPPPSKPEFPLDPHAHYELMIDLAESLGIPMIFNKNGTAVVSQATGGGPSVWNVSIVSVDRARLTAKIRGPAGPSDDVQDLRRDGDRIRLKPMSVPNFPYEIPFRRLESSADR